MSLVKTNEISLQVAIEASLATLPGSPIWNLLEPNTINSFGATITKTARNPISKLRQRRKGTTTDIESGVEFEADLTGDHFKKLAEGFVFAAFSSFNGSKIQAGALFQDLVAETTGSQYQHDALAGAIPVGRLVYARGFDIAGNNGLSVVSGSPTTTVTPVTGLTLIDEVPGNTSGATLEVCGVRTAAGDIDITVTGTTGILTSTTLNFTTLGLVVGQLIYIGGVPASGAITRFLSGRHGSARVTSIAANALGLDKIRTTPAAIALTTEANAAQTIDILFGRFLRNVDVDHASYLAQSYQFELAYPDLGGVGTDGYEYAKGNYSDTMSVALPGQDKSTVTFGYVGTDTPAATTTRASGASTPVEPVETTAFNTSTDLARLRVENVDHDGLTTCFKSMTITLANGVTAEKCLGSLGALGLNTGNFLVDIEAQATFDNVEVTTAIRDNETVTLDWVTKNGDGAIGWDLPALTLGGGDKEFPVGETVRINLTGEVFADPTLGTSIGLSLFPVYPTDGN
jgi:hypothetical protein